MFAIGLVGCAPLGPVPATTAVSPLPAPAPEAEAQLAFVPGYFLSQSTTEDPGGASMGQLSLAVEPGRLIGAPGLVAGVRVVGPEEDTQTEPMLGYRAVVDAERRIAVLGIVHGTHARGEHENASYEATRLGGELAGDMRVGKERRWVELHLRGSLAAQYVNARGTYCQDENLRFGVDCPDPPDPPVRQTTARGKGVYPAATLGLSLELLRHRASVVHGVRLFAMVAAGTMPRVESGEQTDFSGYAAIGFGAAISFGAR